MNRFCGLQTGGRIIRAGEGELGFHESNQMQQPGSPPEPEPAGVKHQVVNSGAAFQACLPFETGASMREMN